MLVVLCGTFTVVSFILTCSKAKLSHVNKNKGVADWGPVRLHHTFMGVFQQKIGTFMDYLF